MIKKTNNNNLTNSRLEIKKQIDIIVKQIFINQLRKTPEFIRGDIS